MSPEFGAMPMVSSEGGDADSEQTGTVATYCLPTCPPTPTPTLGIPIPHSCSTANCTFYLARAHPRFRSCTAALHTPTFGDVGSFVLSALEPRPRTPRTAPALPLRQTVTSVPARILLILHLCLPLFAVHLARTAPPPYYTHPLPSPHSSLHLSWSSPSIWLSTASASGPRIRLLMLIH
ncbi:hypothetical protein B0H13DRAFT_2358160 [Mycena leptocephala]|nr:hypothetical protein B0H13DRAFT_2358160 [Mycena leptocephala]